MHIEIVRTYGGQEGRRVKPGVQFWGGDPRERPSTVPKANIITVQRASDLVKKKLAIRLDEPTGTAAPGRRTAVPPGRRTGDIEPKTRKKVEPKPIRPKNPEKTVKKPARTTSKKKTVSKTPPAPKKVTSGAGSQTGKAASSSASPADPPIKASTSKPSKKRRGSKSDSSPSTTPSNSAPSQTSSTEQTGDGGASSDPKSQTSEVLE